MLSSWPFFLKKLVAHLLMPLPLLLILLVVGLILSWRQLSTSPRLCLFLGIIGLFFLGLEPVSNALVRPLETRYPPLTGARLALLSRHPPPWIVVLGNGHAKRSDLVALQLLNDTSLARLVEGLRLQRILPGSHLIMSGGSPFPRDAEAPLLKQAALELGVKPQTVKIEDQSLDTAEEARYVHRLVGGASFILVTSAVHMPRAMALFRKKGMHPIAAPTGYLGNPASSPIDRYFPESSNLLVSQLAIYEYLGLTFEYVLGYFKPSAEGAL